MPLILSFIISNHDFNTLKKYAPILNNYFLENIEIRNIKYKLIGIIFQKTINSYIILFKYKNILSSVITDNWCLYDDLKGYIGILDSKNIGHLNIRNSYAVSLVIYLKYI